MVRPLMLLLSLLGSSVSIYTPITEFLWYSVRYPFRRSFGPVLLLRLVRNNSLGIVYVVSCLLLLILFIYLLLHRIIRWLPLGNSSYIFIFCILLYVCFYVNSYNNVFISMLTDIIRFLLYNHSKIFYFFSLNAIC